MNCLDFRRVLATEPRSRDPDFLAHRSECAECAAAAGNAERLEALLREAANVEIPERFDARVLLRQSFAAAERARRRRRRVLAIAASVVVAAGLIAMGLHRRDTADTLPADVLASEVMTLVDKAAYALEPTEPVSGRDVRAALQPLGLRVDGEMGRVTFAGRCYVRGLLAGHLVVSGQRAPVTVLVIPDVRIAGRAAIRGEHYAGVLVPVDYGTIAIVGSPGELLAPVETSVATAVHRPT